MNYKLLVDTALLAGEIMLESGAETYRVEETMTRILNTSGLSRCEVFVVSTGIYLTLDDASIDAISLVKRVEERNTNLGNITAANHISRRVCNSIISLEEAYTNLKNLRSQKRYSNWLKYICMIITSASFTVLLGATFTECIMAAVNGCFIVIGDILNKKLKIHRFVTNMLESGVIAFTTVMMKNIPGITIQLEPVIAGSIMVLLPGVAITNAIRDTLQGDYMSGAARVIEAFVIAASIAVGIGAGLTVSGLFLGVIK